MILVPICSAKMEASDGFLPAKEFDGGNGSSKKSHILKSVACSTNISTVSPVRSIIEQTSSNVRSIKETPPGKFETFQYSHKKVHVLMVAKIVSLY